MRTILTELLLKALKPALPGVMLVVGEVKKGLSRPCVQLLPETLSLKQELSRRWRWGEEMSLNWYPPRLAPTQSKPTQSEPAQLEPTQLEPTQLEPTQLEPPENAGEMLLMLVKKAVPAADVTAAAEGDHLKLHIEWEQLYFLDAKEAEKMKRLVLEFQPPV